MYLHGAILPHVCVIPCFGGCSANGTVEEDVVKLLAEVKNREQLGSYNETIKKLLKMKELSMFGADKKLKKWKESGDRARFR